VHARRPFFVMADIEENARRKAAGKKEIPLSPIAIEVARRIDALFAIEQSINGKSPEERLAVRRVTSRTLVDALMTYMREQAAKLSRGHDLAKAIQSMLKRWPRRRHVQPHRHGKDERRRSAGVARRRAQAHRRARLIGSTSCCRGTGERRLWAMRKPLKPSAAFSEAERARVTAACERFIDEFLKPRFLPSIRPTEFNYPVDILGKWHGAKYRFIQRYRSGFPENLGEEFDAPFARLDWISHPVASPHRRMVPPPSRPHSRHGDRNAPIRPYPPPRGGPIPEPSADRRTAPNGHVSCRRTVVFVLR
jgi:hypothetical protein